MALGTTTRSSTSLRYETSTATTTNHWHSYNNNSSDDESEDALPKDPRQWTRENVAQWVRFLTTQHNLPEVSPSRFLMNGKALCLMTPSMFLDRVPLGGKLFYKDFQLRLCSTLYSSKCCS